jgi:sugar O-acyltransferase (sialic acid O-acetyltransferase NeuD family)
MKNLYIVGAGGFGREVYAWLQHLPAKGVDWELRGFLDDDLNALNGFEYDLRVVGAVMDFEPTHDDLFVCGIGSVAAKRRSCQHLLERGARFFTLVHPTALVGANVVLGEGVVLCPRVTVTCDVQIGAMTMVNCHSTIGHDASIGAWSTISAHCDLTGFTRVGEGSFLGSGARVIPGKTVGSGAVVGAGSVVIRSVADGRKVFGNPAREFA